MFACNVYRMDAAFEENIRAELRDNLARIRHHMLGSSLCNNEMEFGWVDWADVVTHHPALKADYIKMFEYVIPQEARLNAPDVFYWPSCALLRAVLSTIRTQRIGEMSIIGTCGMD